MVPAFSVERFLLLGPFKSPCPFPCIGPALVSPSTLSISTDDTTLSSSPETVSLRCSPSIPILCRQMTLNSKAKRSRFYTILFIVLLDRIFTSGSFKNPFANLVTMACHRDCHLVTCQRPALRCTPSLTSRMISRHISPRIPRQWNSRADRQRPSLERYPIHQRLQPKREWCTYRKRHLWSPF